MQADRRRRTGQALEDVNPAGRVDDSQPADADDPGEDRGERHGALISADCRPRTTLLAYCARRGWVRPTVRPGRAPAQAAAVPAAGPPRRAAPAGFCRGPGAARLPRIAPHWRSP